MTPTTSGEMHNDEFTPAWTKDISFQLGKALSPADASVELVSLGCSTLTIHCDCIQYQQEAADFLIHEFAPLDLTTA